MAVFTIANPFFMEDRFSGQLRDIETPYPFWRMAEAAAEAIVLTKKCILCAGNVPESNRLLSFGVYLWRSCNGIGSYCGERKQEIVSKKYRNPSRVMKWRGDLIGIKVIRVHRKQQ